MAGIYIDTYIDTWYVSAVAKFDEKGWDDGKGDFRL